MYENLKKGESFAGCEILALCGKGSYGVTYLAKNPIGKIIAVKIISLPHALERELRGLKNYMAVSGEQPGLLKVFHIGKQEHCCYYTMEAADNCGDGENYIPATLGNLMRQGRRFPPEEAVAISRELLNGISVMHKANLIHRDIKPDNIIFVNGKAKLSDPGLVIAEQEYATFAGTLGFIPPEMLEGGIPANKQSDLFAIGKVFYCMATGNPPKMYPRFPDDMDISICRQLFPVFSCACDRDAEKRFQSAEDFLKELPETFAPPTLLEKTRTDFRNWKKLNSEKFRRILAAVCCFCMLLLLSASAGYIYKSRQEKVLAELKNKVETFLAVDQERKGLTMFQLEVYLPELLPDLLAVKKALEESIKKKDYRKAAENVSVLQKQLRSAAERLKVPLPARSGGLEKDLASAGRCYGFLSAPLAQYLPRTVLEKYKQELAAFEKTLYSGYSGPRCGVRWGGFSNFQRHAVFVPPGAVKMKHTGKIHKLPYHFWIWEKEVSIQDFSHFMGISPQYSPHINTPVERVSWNDILYFAYIMTESLRNNNSLPPSYIVRPPTEAEWEYVANNAWLGPDKTKFEDRAVIRKNSRNRSWPSGSKEPNKLGVYDIYGNMWEIVQPLEKTKMQNSVVIRGGSYMSSESSCYRRIEYLANQFIPYDIGFRLVIAPGNMDYFDKHFFIGEGAKTEVDGKIYELIGANYSCFNRKKAEELAALLGGKLAEFDNTEQFNKVCSDIPLFSESWHCAVGGVKKRDKWVWQNSKKEISFGFGKKMNSGKTEEKYLYARLKKWEGKNENFKFPIFLCQWDKKVFPFRNKQLESGKKLPGELFRFTAGNRKYMLIDSSMLWNTAVRFCELLGGRLACLDTPEIRKEVIKKLEKYKYIKILSGGYAKRNKWYFLNGKEITFNLQKNRASSIPSLNRNFAVLYNGEFYDSQFSQAFLCEWVEGKGRENSASSILR